ncbi:MAG: hypothetical protein AB7T31_13365 [Gemmatimonadales bacterium]
MIMNWIGRVFGAKDPSHEAELLLARTARPDLPAVLSSMAEAVDSLSSELDRARRYNHSLSVVVLTASPITGSPEQNGAGGTFEGAALETSLPQVVSLLAAGVLRDVVRKSDIVCYWPSENRFVMALAESDVHSGRKAIRRIEELFRNRLRLNVHAGLARFPDDGLTLDALVSRAGIRALEGPPTRRPANGTNGTNGTNGAHAANGKNGHAPKPRPEVLVAERQEEQEEKATP